HLTLSLFSFLPPRPPTPPLFPYTTLFRSKTPPDPPIHADAVRDFFDVRPARCADGGDRVDVGNLEREEGIRGVFDQLGAVDVGEDRKSTRLNSSHVKISYAVFCLKKKKKK